MMKTLARLLFTFAALAAMLTGPKVLAGVLTITTSPPFEEIDLGEGRKLKYIIISLLPPVSESDQSREITFSSSWTTDVGSVTEWGWNFGPDATPDNSDEQNPGLVKFSPSALGKETEIYLGVTHMDGETQCSLKDNPVSKLFLVPVEILEIREADHLDNVAPNPKQLKAYNNTQQNPANKYRIFVAVEPGGNMATFRIKTRPPPNLAGKKALIGLRMGQTIMNEFAEVEQDGEVDYSVTVTTTSWPEANYCDFIVGIDKDDSGALEASEAYNTGFTASVITATDYTAQVAALRTASWTEPHVTSAFLACFLQDSQTIDGQNSAGNAQFAITDTKITHIAGSTYSSGSTNIPLYNLPNGSGTSDAIEASAADSGFATGLAKVLVEIWDAQADTIKDHFMNNPTDNEEVFGPFQLGTSLNFYGSDIVDLNTSFGIADVESGSASFTVKRDAVDWGKVYAKKITVNGVASDVYDFDLTRGVNSASRRGATVQIGHQPGQRHAGRIFKVRVTIDAEYQEGSSTINQFQWLKVIDLSE